MKPRCSRLSSVFTMRPAERQCGRILSLSVSPWIIGYPHRIRALERVLTRILNIGSVWHATGMDIVTAFKSQVSSTVKFKSPERRSLWLFDIRHH